MKGMKLILERSPAENGAASLAMLLAYFGKPVPVRTLAEEGCRDAGEILSAAYQHGLNAEGRQLDWNQLKTAPLPCIVSLDFSTFAVLTGLKGNKAELYSPTEGVLYLSRTSFERRISGNALCVSSMEQEEKSRAKPLLLPAPPRSLRLFLAGIGLFSGCCTLLTAGLAGNLAAGGFSGGKSLYWWVLLIMALLVTASAWMCREALHSWAAAWGEEAYEHWERAFNQIGQEALNSFSPAGLPEAVEAGKRIPALLQQYWFSGFLAVPAVIAAVGVLIRAPLLGAGLLLPQIILLTAYKDTAALRGELRLADHEKHCLGQKFYDEETRAFGWGPLKQEQKTLDMRVIGGNRPASFHDRCTLAIACAVSTAAVLLTGIWAVSIEQLSGAGFFSCLLLSGLELLLFSGFWGALPAKAALKNALEDVEALPKQIGAEKDFPKPGRLTLQNLSAETKEGEWLLHNVTLSLERGEVLALVTKGGEQIASLLAGETEPGQGAVYLGGYKLSELNARQRFAAVRRLSGEKAGAGETILARLCTNAPEAGEGDLLKALEDVGLGKTVYRGGPGLDTPVCTLSAGEQMLLSAAGAFAEGVPFLAAEERHLRQLDEESLSCLLAAAKRRQAGFVLLMEDGRDTAFCDRVCRLEEGRIAWKE